MEHIIMSWRDLEQFGIEALTGEADGTGLRLLCDISPGAAEMLEHFFCMRFPETNTSWNHSGIAGWKSMMLPREIFSSIARFALIWSGCYVTAYVDYHQGGISSHYVVGFEDPEEFVKWTKKANVVYKGEYYLSYATGNEVHGTRMRHEMSGRSE